MILGVASMLVTVVRSFSAASPSAPLVAARRPSIFISPVATYRPFDPDQLSLACCVVPRARMGFQPVQGSRSART